MADQVTKSVIVKGDLHRIYELWSDFENFPKFMKPIKSIRKMGDLLSHWTVEGPFGTKVEWDAITTRKEPDQRIAWTSKDDGDIKTSGQVTFMKLPRDETQVTATMKYQPMAGLASPIFETLFGNLEKQMEENLHRFKKHAEEVLHSATDRGVTVPLKR